jgi:hypothetical protein
MEEGITEAEIWAEVDFKAVIWFVVGNGPVDIH